MSTDKLVCTECRREDGCEYTGQKMSFEFRAPIFKLTVKVYQDPDHPDDRTKDRAICRQCVGRWPLVNIYVDQMPRAQILGTMKQVSDAGISLGFVGDTVLTVAGLKK